MEGIELVMKYLKANVNMPKEDEDKIREFFGAAPVEDVEKEPEADEDEVL